MNAQSLTVKTAIRERRSIKVFNGQPVDAQDILEIFEDAKWAPNHGNRQPWRAVVAAGDNLSKFVYALRDFAVPNWKELSEEELDKKMAKLSTTGAMAVVIMKEDLRQKERLEDFGAVSSFLQNAQLLAWDRGIGTCWKTPGWLEKPDFLNLLNIQQGERPVALLQFGYFDEIPKEKSKKSVEEFVTFFGE